jgi:hypothetical protein
VLTVQSAGNGANSTGPAHGTAISEDAMRTDEKSSGAYHSSATRASALALGLSLLAGAACRAVPVSNGLLSDSAVRLDLPLVNQDALYDCGLASISALCV